MLVPYERFLVDVAVCAGFSSANQSERAAQAVLAVIGSIVPSAVRKDLYDALPEELADSVEVSEELPPFPDADSFAAAVAANEHVPLGFAKEHAIVVCQEFGDVLPPELLLRIRKAIGDPVARCFRRPPREAPPPTRRVKPASGDDRRTISSGRPGGLHPISEAVRIAFDNSLARGRPGGLHPMSEARPGGENSRRRARPGPRGQRDK